MNKSLKSVLIVIGILTISAGIYSWFYKNDNSNAYFSFFFGVLLIGGAFFIGTPKKK